MHLLCVHFTNFFFTICEKKVVFVTLQLKPACYLIVTKYLYEFIKICLHFLQCGCYLYPYAYNNIQTYRRGQNNIMSFMSHKRYSMILHVSIDRKKLIIFIIFPQCSQAISLAVSTYVYCM